MTWILSRANAFTFLWSLPRVLHMRLTAHILAITLCLAPCSALALASETAEITFSHPVRVRDGITTDDVLRQSDNYKDGVLTVGGHDFVFDVFGHPVLRQPDQGLWCRWFGIFCTEPRAGTMRLSLDAAKDIVRSAVIPAIQAEMKKDAGRVLPLLAFSWMKPLPKGTVVFQDDARNPPLNVLADSWFIFLDLEPSAY